MTLRTASFAAVLLVPGFAIAGGSPLSANPNHTTATTIDLTRYGRLHKSLHATASPLLFSAPAFTEYASGAAGNPFPKGLAETFSTPTLADIDNDGDLDLVSGENLGGFVYLENVGDNTTPAFVQRLAEANILNGIDIGDKTSPCFVDLDGDGDFDIVSGRQTGHFRYIVNGGDKTTPSFSVVQPADNPLAAEDNGNRSKPAFGDIDGDGDFDMISGDMDGSLTYYENTGDVNNPAFAMISGGASPVAGFDVGDYSTPALADVDADGDLDLVVGENTGVFFYFQNQGDANNPNFVAVEGAGNPFNGFDAGDKSSPAFADLDNATGIDMISGNVPGDYFYYENSDPLPVELTSFDAVANGAEVTLTWTTASETNNAGFEIQRRSGRGFEVVGWVEGAGTSTEARSYTFTLASSAPGRQVYRLRQVDFDGGFSFSGTRQLIIALGGLFHMGDPFPNPFNPQATFTLTVARTQNVTVAVYDMQGRMVSLLQSGSLEGEQPYSFRLDGSAWASGKYLIRAVGESFESSRIVTLVK